MTSTTRLAMGALASTLDEASDGEELEVRDSEEVEMRGMIVGWKARLTVSYFKDQTESII